MGWFDSTISCCLVDLPLVLTCLKIFDGISTLRNLGCYSILLTVEVLRWGCAVVITLEMMAFFRELEISKLRIYSLGSHELSGAPNTVDGSENPANMANNQLIW